jgi:hypothetical protein
LQLGNVSPQVVATLVVVVLVVVVVVLPTQPVALHASQQLVAVPTHAWPPLGAMHDVARRLTLHLAGLPDFVRQQVTAPGLPQVERAAHLRTADWHWRGSCPVPARMVATAAAQRTYSPWLVAPAQLQSIATWARAAATAVASPGASPHLAKAGRATPTDSTRSESDAARCRMTFCAAP